MKLSDEQVQRILDRFAAAVGHFACPMCGGESATVEAKVYTAPEFGGINGISSDDDMALVAMTCDNCGHVSFFSAEVLGVI